MFINFFRIKSRELNASVNSSNAVSVITPHVFNRVELYGVKLINLPTNIEIDIIYYRRPSSLIEVDFKTPI